MNPFGVYAGQQMAQPTWASGLGYQVTLQTGVHFASAAPTYNGKTIRFALAIGFFQGEKIPELLRGQLKFFANPGVVMETSSGGELTRPWMDSEISNKISSDIQGKDKHTLPLGLQLNLFGSSLKNILD